MPPSKTASAKSATAEPTGDRFPEGPSAEALQTQIDVSVTQVRQLVSSWLPPLSGEEEASTTELHDLQAGTAASQAANAARRYKNTSTEALRKTMMGSGPRHSRPEKPATIARKPTGFTKKHHLVASDDESDEDAGRSSLGKSKRAKNNRPPAASGSGKTDGAGSSADSSHGGEPKKAQGGQLLPPKSKKRKNKH